jgi:hypothetical protein
MAKIAKKKSRRRAEHHGIVGRHGRIRFGQRSVKVVVVEDRGPVGYSGRRLVRVRFVDPTTDPSNSFEIPVDELVLKSAHA